MKKTFTNLKLMTGLCLLFIFSANAQITVTNANNAGVGSFRQAVLDVSAGGAILFDASLDGTTITLLSEVTIDKDIVINGNGNENTIISGNGMTRVFLITAGNVVINNIKATNGSALDNGGAISVSGGTTLMNNCIVSDSNAMGALATNGGGGIYVSNGSLTLNVSTVTNNTASGVSGSGGGILVGTDGSLTVNGSVISDNMANRAGGGIEVNSATAVSISLNDTTLSGNTAGSNPGNGGGLHITGASNATISGGVVTDNTATSEGGGLWNGSGTMTITGTVISENTASGAASDQGGGGIYNLSGMLNINAETQITGNVADGAAGSGGGILNDVGGKVTINDAEITLNVSNRAGGGIEDNSGSAGFVNMTNVTLNNNTTNMSPGNGGGLHVTGAGMVTITGGTVSDNEAGAEGGGLWNGTGTMTIEGTVIANNTASGAGADQGGGGIYNLSGMLNISGDTMISGNMATGAAGSGGGILNDVNGKVTIEDTEITANIAMRAGGGIEDNGLAAGFVTMNNVTITLNNAGVSPGNGGGVHMTGMGNVTITNSIVSGNTAVEGGGLWNGTGTMTVSGVNIMGNTATGVTVTEGGGGIFNNGGTLNVSASTLSANAATGLLGQGGGIHVNGGTAVVTTTTLSGNTSVTNGGGIYNNGMLTLNADTFSLNAALVNGGGIANEGTNTVSIKNTLVAGNTAIIGADLFGADNTIVSGGYNLVAVVDGEVFVDTENDIMGSISLPIEITLSALTEVEDGTPVHKLSCPSPAADMGDPMDTFADQNGFAVFNGTRDIGAYEAQEECTTAGIEEFAANRSIVYPNPSNGVFNIMLASNYNSDVNISIYEIATGKLVKTMKTDAMNIEIGMTGISTGAYVMQIVSDNASETHKLIVN
ncbi:T9SS type A sorting domain-containing protein [Flavobacterium sp. AG291]|uniref:T9SS type A sorting domain-containing protein n=1 Tax=Flavobacterium sp. AG291 TaxID=2184000 RepID=UPI000E0A54B4|nr:T9SS type A sorting domain-containing protein [Flavobacterium sp. AG291]RDI06955.1 putative secreted protein (Por secretion system target) [Flavobacterium sp. AG291]